MLKLLYSDRSGCRVFGSGMAFGSKSNDGPEPKIEIWIPFLFLVCIYPLFDGTSQQIRCHGEKAALNGIFSVEQQAEESRRYYIYIYIHACEPANKTTFHACAINSCSCRIIAHRILIMCCYERDDTMWWHVHIAQAPHAYISHWIMMLYILYMH